MNISIEERQKVEQDFLKKLILNYKEYECYEEEKSLETNVNDVLFFLEEYLIRDKEDEILWNTNMDIVEEEIEEAA